MTELGHLRVYATYPHRCSYLPDRQATTLFIDPAVQLDSGQYSQLSELGFRRSGGHVYRPNCSDCNACIPTRLPVNEFRWSRRFRRIMRANCDLSVEVMAAPDPDLMYPLYSRYIEQRHADGDMYPPSREQFLQFLTAEFGISRFYCFYRQKQLVAVAVADVLNTGISAIYSFYDPDLPRRSLGSFMILWQLREAERLNLPYLYLGYWVRECQKMAYKIEYRPVQLLLNQQWLTMR